MKKLLLLLLGVLMVLPAFATDFRYTYEGNTLWYTIVDEYNKTCKLDGPYGHISGTLLIPAKAVFNDEEYAVTEISDHAFNANIVSNEMTSVEIPYSVISIGNSAFYGCKGLTSIKIPNSVISIGRCAFYGCNALSSIEIGNSVTSIGSEAFSECSGLTSIEIPNSVTEIGWGAFYKCMWLKEITIADGSSTLNFDKAVFYDVRHLTKLYVGRNLSYASSSYNDAPFSKTNLTELIIGDSVTAIASSSFHGCWHLTSVDIPGSVTTIGSGAFKGCSGLTSVQIPSSVTSIGNSAFQDCSNLKAVTIADGGSTLNIGENVFSGVDLSKLYLGRNLSNIDASPFKSKSSLTELTIGNSVTSISSNTFYGCNSLTSIEIPNSVTSIGNSAFQDCSNLKAVTIADGGSTLNIGENVFSGVDLSKLYLGRNLSNIDASPFKSKSSLTELTIGNSVTSISSNTFYGCSGLTLVKIGNSVTSIGSEAFYGCSGLTSVELPNSVTSIGNSVFSHCRSLTAVEIPNFVTSIGTAAFYGCSSLTSIEIPNSVTSIGNSAFYDCIGLTSVRIGDSVTSIGNSVFSYCQSLTSVEIPHSVTSIGNSSFSHCRGLTSIKIPNSVTSIGNSVFSYCQSLTSVEIPNSVTSIGNSAFYFCSKLKDITIADSETNLEFGEEVFDSCPLETLYVGRNFSCTSDFNPRLPFYAKSIKTLTISNTVTKIGDSAFANCGELISVYYNAEVPMEANLNVFSDYYNTIYNRATLYVPAGSVEKCKRIEPWKRFRNIKAFDFTSGIQEISEDIDESLPYEIFTLDGHKVIGDLDSLSPGIYIIRQGNTVKKIAVK